MEAYLITVGRPFNPGAGKILQFIVNLIGMQQRSFAQPLGHAECRVTRKGANLEHTLGAGQLHQHLEQSALQMPRCHARVDELQVCLAVERLQVVTFLIHVLQDVCLYSLVVGHNANNASMASL